MKRNKGFKKKEGILPSFFALWVLLEYNGYNKISYYDEKEDSV